MLDDVGLHDWSCSDAESLVFFLTAHLVSWSCSANGTPSLLICAPRVTPVAPTG